MDWRQQLSELLDKVETESLKFGTRSNVDHWTAMDAARQAVMRFVQLRLAQGVDTRLVDSAVPDLLGVAGVVAAWPHKPGECEIVDQARAAIAKATAPAPASADQ